MNISSRLLALSIISDCCLNIACITKNSSIALSRKDTILWVPPFSASQIVSLPHFFFSLTKQAPRLVFKQINAIKRCVEENLNKKLGPQHIFLKRALLLLASFSCINYNAMSLVFVWMAECPMQVNLSYGAQLQHDSMRNGCQQISFTDGKQESSDRPNSPPTSRTVNGILSSIY